MAAVDGLAKRAGKTHSCGRCPHSNQWHERTEDGHVVIGGRCQFPGCDCGNRRGEGYAPAEGRR